MHTNLCSKFLKARHKDISMPFFLILYNLSWFGNCPSYAVCGAQPNLWYMNR